MLGSPESLQKNAGMPSGTGEMVNLTGKWKVGTSTVWLWKERLVANFHLMKLSTIAT